MVPWPIALVTLYVGVIATLSAAMVFRIVSGTSTRSLVWPLAWLGVSLGVVCGLPLLKSWARHLAVVELVCVTVVMLAVAGGLVMSGRPVGGLLATLGVSVPLVAIRYLRRPSVKAWFGEAGDRL